ncbi:MAG: hypothetical protein HQL31_07440, partial [Planctomycetes bacterium]|nr:hypothetical protein [Planctomycetota bacterium]
MDSPGSKIPPQDSAWIETSKPDLDTLLLWKFGESAALAERGLFFEPDQEEHTAPSLALPPLLAKGHTEPCDEGRFGPGLRLGEGGLAECKGIDFRSLLKDDGGLTLDFWFKPDVLPALNEPILCLADQRGQPLLVVRLNAAGNLELAVSDRKVAGQEVACQKENWSHLGLAITSQPYLKGVRLLVNGKGGEMTGGDEVKILEAAIGRSAWLGGFKGVIDEVRLRRRVRYFHEWHLQEQEVQGRWQETAMAPPFFRSSLPLCRFRFDGDLKPEQFHALKVEGMTGERHFKPGYMGQALDLSHIDTTGFRLIGHSVLPDAEATLEFFFRPLDWHNYYVGNFFGSDVAKETLFIQKLKSLSDASWYRQFRVSMGRSLREVRSLRWNKFQPGRWTHVILSLASSGNKGYINGIEQPFWQLQFLMGSKEVQKAHEEWLSASKGKDDGNYEFKFMPSRTLIDEFSVYGWAFTAQEAANAYARWRPKGEIPMKPIPPFKIGFDYFARSWEMNNKLDVRLRCFPVDERKPAFMDFTISSLEGKPILAQENMPVDESGELKMTIPHTFDFGHYPLKITSRDKEGALIAEEESFFERSQPDWYRNELGKDRSVPKPWIPIRTEGRELFAWGRKITLGPGGLPSGIKTLGREVLADGISIFAKGPEGKVRLEGSHLDFKEKSGDRVLWEGELKGAGLKARLSAWMEYDGLMYFKIDLKPEKGEIDLEELDVDFPMVGLETSQLIANAGGKNFRAAYDVRHLPKGEGCIWNSLDSPRKGIVRALEVGSFMPLIWLGGDDVGLSFSGENDRGWTFDVAGPAQEILRQEDRIIFRMNVIGRKVRIGSDGRVFHFILLPTPAKPEPEGWRADYYKRNMCVPIDNFSGFSLKVDPENRKPDEAFLVVPESWETATAQAAKLRELFGSSILYLDASWPQPGPEFADWNHDLWGGTGRIAWIPELEDYMVWVVNEYLRRDLIDGFYMDDVSVGQTLALDSTAYRVEDYPLGRRKGFTFMGLRRFAQRVWKCFLDHGKKPDITFHMTYCYELPAFSFITTLFNGEDRDIKPYQERDCIDTWPTDFMRILGGAGKWGAATLWKATVYPEGSIGKKREQWLYHQMRAMYGTFLISDHLSSTLIDGPLIRALQQSGFDEPGMRALPWWKTTALVKLDGKNADNV